MEETRTGGGKEFIFAVIWSIVLIFAGEYIIYLLPSWKAVGIIVTILMFCVLGFFVLTRYAAVYTFSLKNDRLRVNRKIGHRNKEVDFAVSDVKSVTRQRPSDAPKYIQTTRTSVFSRKNIWYVVYEKNRVRNMLVCDMSKNMADKLKSRAKNTKAKA
ncbi:MAG: hypothetical protein LIO53_01815 [Oscillospiraceae bacterium]|nr:hypothetical protein [Oscillospiraceae bacterium]